MARLRVRDRPQLCRHPTQASSGLTMERTTPPAGPRMLLKRLRDTMARADSPDDTLGEVVRLVANEMVAEVCSIYLLRAGEVLELFATQGLNPTAVHRTRLRMGEGLVGDIAAHARSLALDDARRPARRSTTRSPACRSCGPVVSSACWWSRTARAVSTTKKRSRRCRPSPW